jgi:hypothetical protein
VKQAVSGILTLVEIIANPRGMFRVVVSGYKMESGYRVSYRVKLIKGWQRMDGVPGYPNTL